MIILELSQLKNLEQQRKKGYYDHVVSCGNIIQNKWLILTKEIYNNLQNYYAGIGKKPNPNETVKIYKNTQPLCFTPGDLLTLLITKITKERICSPCNKRQRQMNEWGWWKCWKNRDIIVQWLAEEAKKRGYVINDSEILSLIKSIFQEIKKKRKNGVIFRKETYGNIYCKKNNNGNDDLQSRGGK